MWSTEKTLHLIESFHSASCLWDVTLSEYKNRDKKKVELNNIAKKLDLPVADVDKKIHNLKTQFYREHRKVKQEKKSGSSPSKSGWFAYKHLLFLLRGVESRGSRNTDCEEDDNNSEVSKFFKSIYFHITLQYFFNTIGRIYLSIFT